MERCWKTLFFILNIWLLILISTVLVSGNEVFKSENTSLSTRDKEASIDMGIADLKGSVKKISMYTSFNRNNFEKGDEELETTNSVLPEHGSQSLKLRHSKTGRIFSICQKLVPEFSETLLGLISEDEMDSLYDEMLDYISHKTNIPFSEEEEKHVLESVVNAFLEWVDDLLLDSDEDDTEYEVKMTLKGTISLETSIFNQNSTSTFHPDEEGCKSVLSQLLPQNRVVNDSQVCEERKSANDTEEKLHLIAQESDQECRGISVHESGQECRDMDSEQKESSKDSANSNLIYEKIVLMLYQAKGEVLRNSNQNLPNKSSKKQRIAPQYRKIKSNRRQHIWKRSHQVPLNTHKLQKILPMFKESALFIAGSAFSTIGNVFRRSFKP